ncbi:SCO family protein [Shewanella litorisediminis]|uniref:SCO family protein n=1 Tax=Shewanella litorisediminis TaxID=1173586 RepID=A0ABX7G1A5_9GAMM|nr:SCO family protein [Shewanella litorisediminis]MCL2918895.1 SCO family protein [Shewanella litorisediminis]QRH00968.1 SCO family protein [Shewanella litorisediminis]
MINKRIQAAAFVGNALSILSLLFVLATAQVQAQMPVLKGIGGDFSMQSSKGTQVNLSDFRGKVVMMFFGYTNCADICPTTMAHISQLMQKMPAEERARIQVLFVSIDSDYDTPKHLNKYLSYFDPSFIGLVDERAKIDEVAAMYHADYSKLADDKVTTEYKKLRLERQGSAGKGYLYSHTAKIFVLDPEGRVRGFFYTGTPLDEMQADISSLLNPEAQG